MPTARHDGVDLHWEATGDGEPVLLVMGLGMSATGWWRTVPVLAERFRVLTFDNRGMGRSGRPAGPYSTAGMAGDCAAVLDAAGVDAAHVYGISLGGMIAQEVALRHSARVRRLALGATTPGGPRHVAPDAATLAFFHRRAELSAEEAVWSSVPYNYGPATRAGHGQRIAEDIVERLRFPVEPGPYAAQLEAALGHDAHGRLGAIRAPTLVVHGLEDRMVLPANARLLTDAIPGARVHAWPGAGHLYPTDEPRADRAVAEFLSGRSSPGPS